MVVEVMALLIYAQTSTKNSTRYISVTKVEITLIVIPGIFLRRIINLVRLGENPLSMI